MVSPDTLTWAPDTIVWPTVVQMAECLCTQITDSGLPEPCFCGVFSGSQASFDYCDGCEDGTCGQAWVRLSSLFPSEAFPALSETAKCNTLLAFTLEVGILRCAPVGDEQGNPPSLADHFETASLQMADAMAMRRAIYCCTALTKGRDYLLGPYTPVGPLGGCVGGVWTVSFSEV